MAAKEEEKERMNIKKKIKRSSHLYAQITNIGSHD